MRLGDCSISVTSNDGPLISELADYFRAFLAQGEVEADIHVSVHQAPVPDFGGGFVPRAPEPGKTKIKEEYRDLPDGRIVRKRATGVAFVFGPGDNLALGPCRENLNQVVNFINNRFLDRKLREGGLLGHASGVARDDAGLALAGSSGSGKSTLALQIVSRGADFVSNDRLVLQRSEGSGLRMTGVPKLPRVNPGTIVNNPSLSGLLTLEERESYESRSREELWGLERKYDVPVDRCFGPGRFRLIAPLRVLAVLNWDRRSGHQVRFRRVDPSRREDLLRLLAKSPGLFSTAADAVPALQDYASLLTPVPVYEVTGGTDFLRAAETCLELIRSADAAEAGRS
jgi:HprK-related kinase B